MWSGKDRFVLMKLIQYCLARASEGCTTWQRQNSFADAGLELIYATGPNSKLFPSFVSQLPISI